MGVLTSILLGTALLLTAVTAPVLLWEGVLGIRGLLPRRRRDEPAESAEPPVFHRFAAVVCARNEEAVIGALLDSLRAQDYPADRLDLFVAADNCTDDTAGEAARHGARVYERFNREQVGKGYALRWLLEKIQEERPDAYDVVAVFDADNLVTPDFVRRMNEAFCAGADLVKGSRHASNPADSWVSGAYAIYWRGLMHFFHRAHALWGLSCFVDGTGFAFKTELIRDGGWNTHSLVEDCEFSMQQICRGKTILPLDDAVYYDEQPPSFGVSVRQRYRWTVGCIQCIKYCFSDAWRAFRRGKGEGGPSRFQALDVLCFLLLIPAVALSFVASCCGVLYFLLSIPSPLAGAAILLAVLAAFWLVLSCVAVAIRLLDRQPLRPVAGAILLFPVFMLSMNVIGLAALVHPKTAWKPIAHRGK